MGQLCSCVSQVLHISNLFIQYYNTANCCEHMEDGVNFCLYVCYTILLSLCVLCVYVCDIKTLAICIPLVLCRGSSRSLLGATVAHNLLFFFNWD